MQLRFALAADAAAAVAERLPDLGAIAVDLEAADDVPLFDTGAAAGPLWPITRVTGLFDAEIDLDGVLRALCRDFGWPRLPAHQVEVIADSDWESSYRDWFKPRQFAGRLWVRPSWCAPPRDAVAEVVLDPGMAFGTGAHATTAMCLDWLARAAQVRGARVIDYGCGSGILAIAAARLGAAEVWAIDTDPRAIAVARENAQVNGIEANLRIGPPELIDGVEADIVVANILLEPLVALADHVVTRVRTGGDLVMTGLLDAQAPLCRAAYDSRVDFEPDVSEDGWTLLWGRRTC